MTSTTATRCSICNHPRRAEIEAGLLEGVELRVLVGQHSGSISTSALSRHTQQHLQPALREQALDTPAAPTDLLQRLAEVADDARAARIRARDSGTASAQARAADTETRVLFGMLQTLGVKDTSTITAMAEAEKLAHAVGRFALANPMAAHALILEIKNQGLDDFGQQLDALTKKSLER